MDLQHAYALGLGVIEYAPASKASDEIRALWAWCRKRINGVDHGKTKRGSRRDGVNDSANTGTVANTIGGTKAAQKVPESGRLPNVQGETEDG
jgi:hypothetical protein